MTSKLAAGVALLAAATALDFSPCPQLNDEIAAEYSSIEIAKFDCANVSVPLDYTQDDSGKTLELNVIRVNATEEPILGNILINFGGPGGPGVTNLPPLAEQVRAIIGPQWNLLSWDPRGTGKTIPFQCTPPTGVPTTTNDKRDLGDLVSINGTKGFLQYGWEFAGEIADACYEQADRDTATLIGTAFVARDVMEIVDALDDGNLLHYYGWSYGTALGDYIAVMFPDRVGRMVLDGNVNPHEYQAGTYAHAADDVDEAFDGFLTTCFQAEEDCSLYQLVQPDSAEDLLDTINSGLQPLAAFADLGRTSYVTYVALKNGLIQPLYYPSQWPGLADTITLLLNSTNPTLPNTTTNSTYDEAVNAVVGIRASDATFHANSSDEYLPVLDVTSQVSDDFSDAYYLSLWASARWRMPAKERYWGDFRAETNNPILFVNGEYDPVTPIVGAYNASSGFDGSAVLAHSGYGHGLVASPSRCASRHIQAYLQNGTLPGNGTTCEPDATPLEVWRATVQASENGTTNGTADGGGGSGSSNDSNDDGAASDNGDQSSSEGGSGENAGTMPAPCALGSTLGAALVLGLCMAAL